ncbi:MAG: hypothetical protein ACPG77_06535 [Nannocystaceae bacterium]
MTQTQQVRGTAGADLDGKRNLVVKIDRADNNRIKVASSPTDLDALGILVNVPRDEEPAFVDFEGVTDGIAGGVITPFTPVTVEANGKLVAAVSTNVKLGVYAPLPVDGELLSAAADDLIRVVLFADKTTIKP